MDKDMREQVINNIICAMSPVMETMRLQMLEGAVRGALHGMQLVKECTELSTEMDDNDGNYKAMEYITGAVVLPDDVKTVAKGTFGNCNISELVVPEGVKDIGENAFAGCGDLIRISLPESLKNIGAGAFSGCGVIHLKVPGGVEKIGMDAFYDCKIENLKIPDSVKKIGSGAFEGISHIEYRGTATYRKDSKYWGAKSMN